MIFVQSLLFRFQMLVVAAFMSDVGSFDGVKCHFGVVFNHRTFASAGHDAVVIWAVGNRVKIRILLTIVASPIRKRLNFDNSANLSDPTVRFLGNDLPLFRVGPIGIIQLRLQLDPDVGNYFLLSRRRFKSNGGTLFEVFEN